eukprot:86668-Amphidinium_carterae.1
MTDAGCEPAWGGSVATHGLLVTSPVAVRCGAFPSVSASFSPTLSATAISVVRRLGRRLAVILRDTEGASVRVDEFERGIKGFASRVSAVCSPFMLRVMA